MKTYKVVLAKAGWCGHCTLFTPIFEEASKRKVNGFDNVKFKSYDLENNENPSEKNAFESEYPELTGRVQVYPTVFVIVEEDNKISVANADHTVINPQEPGSKEDKEIQAAEEFLLNVSNAFKSLDSHGKNLFLRSTDNKQDGGSKCCTVSDTINYSSYNLNDKSNPEYKSKYLKYKSKYLELKKKTK